MKTLSCKCIVCGRNYDYEVGGEKGYDRELCSSYCDGLNIGRAHLKSIITANNAYFQSSRTCGINSGPTISAYNEMKIATEAASRFIEGK